MKDFGTCQRPEGGRGPRLTCGLMCRLVAAYSGFMSCISGSSAGACPVAVHSKTGDKQPVVSASRQAGSCNGILYSRSWHTCQVLPMCRLLLDADVHSACKQPCDSAKEIEKDNEKKVPRLARAEGRRAMLPERMVSDSRFNR